MAVVILTLGDCCVKVLEMNYIEISGYTQDQFELPISRTVLLYRDDGSNIFVASTVSSAEDGSFSFITSGNPLYDKFRVLMVSGSNSENDKVFTHVKGINL